ncbi:MAG: hypothetical protein GTN89_04055 [Acidobacteria bacterium]|nr:hypothetical protein [Acidobacteriota bacterium]NIM64023.1 hypothetical protein [Acidobacteriota bacterium]NIO58493.1 hypothetical protein [Acidobacteriota bacterium]NIQ29551.1 hypothetical protein [Acidobacteriota bacterium]NIQ84243.1 hypothetical protein [Acidobacteriota bacterium]
MFRVVLVGALLAVVPTTASEAPEWAVAVFPSGTEFTLEIAATPQERMVGYMFREEVGKNEGMLFLFEATERHGIWMKNCRVPLDIIWLDEQFRVLEIVADAQPCPADGACPSMEPMVAARYVLEIAGGRAAEEKLARGDVLIIHSDPAL